MRRTEGTCIHCSFPIVWDEERAAYVSTSPGGPDLEECGGPGDPHQLDDEAHECAYCEEEFTAEPVRNPAEVTWRGLEWTQIWCSEECMVKYAERAASSEPLGRSDLR